MKGTMAGSIQATDRLMKELKDIYMSPSFKSGAYTVHISFKPNKYWFLSYFYPDNILDATNKTIHFSFNITHG